MFAFTIFYQLVSKKITFPLNYPPSLVREVSVRAQSKAGHLLCVYHHHGQYYGRSRHIHVVKLDFIRGRKKKKGYSGLSLISFGKNVKKKKISRILMMTLKKTPMTA